MPPLYIFSCRGIGVCRNREVDSALANVREKCSHPTNPGEVWPSFVVFVVKMSLGGKN